MSVTSIIRRRRAIYPQSYLPQRPIEREILEQLLENANWAPTHRRTEPWRFHVYHSEESRQWLSQYLSDYYEKNTPAGQFSEEKRRKTAMAPLRAGAVIAIIMQRDHRESVPEFEEIAAVAMAVQNMWLTCTELGLGCYWGTSPAALAYGEHFPLPEGQRCLGFFYVGWHEMPQLPGVRGAIAEKVVWR